MATKIHCDLCDIVGAKPLEVRSANTRCIDKPDVRYRRLGIIIQVSTDDSGESILEVCDECRKKLLADTFLMKTYDEYNALRDECNSLRMQVTGQPEDML